MAWFTVQSSFVIAVSILLGLLLGWLWWGGTRERADTHEPDAGRQLLDRHAAELAARDAEIARLRSHPAPPDEATPQSPEIPAQAGPSEVERDVTDIGPSDALERIEGIGPKIANALRAAGITTFAQLADTDRDALATALSTAGLRPAPSMGTWAQQALLLANGDEDAFLDFTHSLVAGRHARSRS